MDGAAGSGNSACGHYVPPGSRFCPACGQPTAASWGGAPPGDASWGGARPADASWGGAPPGADPDATRVDGLGPVPAGNLPTGMLGDLRQAPASGGPRRSRVPLVPVIVAA